MKILIETSVKESVKEVFSKFNGDLFKALAPPFPPVNLERYDGEQVGDVVSMKLNFILFKQNWTSLITANEQNENRSFFVDEGTELPFFLSEWKHRHIIENRGGTTYIVDDIYFKTPFVLTDYLMYPLLYLQFLYRKPIYRKLFGKSVA
jgi:ligand-binding SRPBCC domain-containing protein